MKITFDWSEEKVNKVKKLIEEFAYKHEVTESESVIQCDDPNIESPVLVGNILDLVCVDYEWEDED